MNIGILKKSSNLHNSVIFRRRVTIIIPACSAGEKAHPMTPLPCVWAPLLAPWNRNIIFFQATSSPSILPSIVIALHGAHNHLGTEAQ